MSTAPSAGDELGDVICVYKHPGLKVALSALGVGALLCVLFIGLRTLWDDVPMGLGLALLLLGLASAVLFGLIITSPNSSPADCAVLIT